MRKGNTLKRPHTFFAVVFFGPPVQSACKDRLYLLHGEQKDYKISKEAAVIAEEGGEYMEPKNVVTSVYSLYVSAFLSATLFRSLY